MMIRMFTTLVIVLLTVVSTWAGPSEDAALREAALNLDIVAVKAALEKGANPNTISSGESHDTPLSLVAMGMLFHRRDDGNSKALEIAKILFSNGAKIGIYEHNILFFPISEGNLKLVVLILDNGASPTAKLEGYTPTELAIKYGRKEVHDLIVSRGGVPVNKLTAVQLTLIQAAQNSDITSMREAVQEGASINGEDSVGTTALINAVRDGVYERRNAEAIWWLLDRGADPNLKGESSFTGLEGIPLHIFVFMNKHTMQGIDKRPEAKALAEKTMYRLLKAGAKISGMDSKGRTPLHIAAEADNLRAAEILIRKGARVMAKDAKGRTPLDYAESASMIRLLKRSGAVER